MKNSSPKQYMHDHFLNVYIVYEAPAEECGLQSVPLCAQKIRLAALYTPQHVFAVCGALETDPARPI